MDPQSEPTSNNQDNGQLNNDFRLTLNKKIIIVTLFFVLFTSIIITGLISNNQNGITPTPPAPIIPSITTYALPTIPAPRLINKIQKTVPGQKIDGNLLTKHPLFISQEQLPNNETLFSFKSEVGVRPDLIILSPDSQVIFERLLIPSQSSKAGFIKLSALKNKYGEPERLIVGSKFYDWYIETHIHATKGIAFVGNPNTDEVFELHLFNSMSINDYIKIYGEDLNPGVSPRPEGI